jgi:hypothetical protein
VDEGAQWGQLPPKLSTLQEHAFEQENPTIALVTLSFLLQSREHGLAATTSTDFNERVRQHVQRGRAVQSGF